MIKTALITGASSGVGYDLALELASKNIFVIAIARRIDKLKKLQLHFPKWIHIISADIALSNEIDEILLSLPPGTKIDYLIHNAAAIGPICSLENVGAEDFLYNLKVNVVAPTHLTNNLLPFLSKNSRILHVISPAATLPRAGLGPYCISKAAVRMLSLIQKVELEKHNIFVSRILPGEVDTEMQKALRETPIEKFAFATEFQKEKDQGSLLSPKIVANFFAWVLLDTSNEIYSDTEWNIYDNSHHQYWLKDTLPLPHNRKKMNFYQQNNARE